MMLTQTGTLIPVRLITSQATWKSSPFVRSTRATARFTASGAGMKIIHIGHTIVPTSSRNIHLNNVIHVPDAVKNIVSVLHRARDNSVFLEFHPDYFFGKGSNHEEHNP
jgi:hypothetical protein